MHETRSLMPRRVIHSLTFSWILFVALLCSAFDSPGPGEPYLLQPATVSSPLGRYALRVSPADRWGTGSASYTLLLDGEQLWSRELPFAFRRFVVRDDGVAAGFAYGDWDYQRLDELSVAALAADGEVLWVHSSDGAEMPEKKRSREPYFVGVHLHGDGETLMLRARLGDSSDFEEWWSFDMATGAVDESPMQRLPSPSPGPRMMSRAGRGVPGTPLALVYWNEFGYGRPADGARYILHAADGRMVWELNLPADLGSQTLSEAEAEAALLSIGERSFEIALLKDDLRVAYVIEEGGEAGWTVRETARRKLGGLTISTPPVEFTPWRAVELDFLGEAVFHAEGDTREPGEPPAPFATFDVDASGRLGGIYDTPRSEVMTFALLDEAGKVLREFNLDPAEEVKLVRWVRDSLWFVYSELTWPSGSWLNVERRELIEIEDWDGLRIVDAEVHPDGDLVVVGQRAIHRFTPPPAGEENSERDWNQPQFDFAPDHFTILAGGELVVAINSSPPRLEIFRADGVREQVIELTEQLGEYGDVDELLAPDDGTLWFRSEVFDRVDGPPVWHRLDAELQPIEPVVLRLDNGVDVGVMLERVGGDGTGWGRDAWGPIRFDLASGRAEPIGSLRIQPMGDSIQALTVDTQGRIYFVGVGDAIFVFDAEGTPLHVCRPERGDSLEGLYFECMSVRGDGHVFAGDVLGDQIRLEFDEHGRRVHIHIARGSEFQWAFVPGGMKEWVLQFPGRVELRNPEGKVEASFDRLHDGRWFSGAWPFAAARDGSFAFSRMDALHVFDAHGEPRHSRSIAYDADEPGYWHPSGILHEGERTILLASDRLVAIHWDDPIAEVFELPEGDYGSVFRSPDGAELWIFPRSEPRMLRFASPTNWR